MNFSQQQPWQKAVLSFSFFAFLVTLVNLILAVVVSARSHGGVAVLAERDCASIRTSNTMMHLLTNVLSSVLLAGSNYTMQCLMGPTRQQINSAHARRRWLDVGVPSLRNFGSMASRDQVFWLLLVLSSVPLHLL